MLPTPANDEPGSPHGRPGARRAHLARLVEALPAGADARAGLGALLREIEALAPGSIEREAARIEMRRLGLAPSCPPDLSCLDWPEPDLPGPTRRSSSEGPRPER